MSQFVVPNLNLQGRSGLVAVNCNCCGVRRGQDPHFHGMKYQHPVKEIKDRLQPI
jgi:hypothetical protein